MIEQIRASEQKTLQLARQNSNIFLLSLEDKKVKDVKVDRMERRQLMINIGLGIQVHELPSFTRPQQWSYSEGKSTLLISLYGVHSLYSREYFFLDLGIRV